MSAIFIRVPAPGHEDVGIGAFVTRDKKNEIVYGGLNMQVASGEYNGEPSDVNFSGTRMTPIEFKTVVTNLFIKQKWHNVIINAEDLEKFKQAVVIITKDDLCRSLEQKEQALLCKQQRERRNQTIRVAVVISCVVTASIFLSKWLRRNK